MPDVQFVDPEPEPGRDEELDTRPTRSAPGSRSVRIGVAAVVVLAAAAVSVVALRSGDHGTSAAQATATRTGPERPTPTRATPTRTTRTRSTASTGAQSPTVARPVSPGPPCTSTAVCRTDVTASSAVLGALRAAYPGVVVDRWTTASTGPASAALRLRSRSVRAHTSRVTIAVEVRPSRAGDRSQVLYADARGDAGVSVAVTDTVRPWTIRVTVIDPSDRAVDSVTPASLAADPRLLET